MRPGPAILVALLPGLGACGSDDSSAETKSACIASCDLSTDAACTTLCKTGCDQSMCLHDMSRKDFEAVTGIMCVNSTVNWMTTQGTGSKTHACKW